MLLGGWLGVIGLALDFIGVVILTLDVLPEFSLHRKTQRLRQLRLNSSHLADGETAEKFPGDDPVWKTTASALAMVRASNASLYETMRFDFLTAQAALNSSAYDFHAADDDVIRVALGCDSFSKIVFEAALAHLEEKAAIASANLSTRRRPNLFWGVFFVLLGFVVQALAAVPDYAQQYLRTLFWTAFAGSEP